MIAGRSASNGCWYLDAEHHRDALDVSCPVPSQLVNEDRNME
jgi:hypothetical protein